MAEAADRRDALLEVLPGGEGNPLVRTWLGVTLISFSGVWVRLAGVEAARSAFLRNAYALPVLALLVWWVRRRTGGAGHGRLVLPVAVIAGLFLGADLIAWHVSVGIIGAGLGTLFPNLQVVFVGIGAMWLFGERPHGSFWAALPIVLAGVLLLGAFGEMVEGSTSSVLVGVLLGVLTALLYAGFLLILRVSRLRRPDAGSAETHVSATLGAAIATGVFAAFEGVAAPTGAWPAEGWILTLALGSQVVGWLMLTSSIHRLPAMLTSVALLLQPALALVWGAVILGEPIGPIQVLGGMVLLAGIALGHRAVVLGQRRVAAEAPAGSRT